MSEFTCPCGFRADGFARESWAAYRAHECQYHAREAAPEFEEESSGMSWPGMLALLAFLIFLSFICTHGWGRFS